jgi:hypothetical protein
VTGEPGRASPYAPLPWWVHVADALAIVLLLLACSAAVTEGVRIRVEGVRLSFTSPWRTLLWAAAVVALRHWRVAHPSLLARLAGWLRHARADESLRAVLPMAVASRVAVLAVGLYAVMAFGFPQLPPPFRVSHNELVNLPARWDAGWYLSIAQTGYYWEPGAAGQSNLAFFPAFPLLMGTVGQLFGRTSAAVLWAGVLVSWVSFIWGLSYVHRLAREHPALASPGRAAAAVMLLVSYPFAVFHGAAYTESVFLLASAAAFHACTHRRWRAVLAWGLLAGLARPNGVLLAPVLGLLVLSGWRADRRLGNRGLLPLLLGLAAAAAPAYGLALHSAYMYDLTGNPLQWAAVHVYWNRTATGWTWITGPASYIGQHGILTFFRDAHPQALNLLAAIFALAVTVPVARRLGLAYGALVLLNVAVPLARGGELSMGRITCVLFPLFLWLAAVLPARHRAAWVTAFAIGQGLMAVLFYTWRPPY